MNFDLKLGKAASVLFLALAMAGCGGGGGTTMTEPPTPVPDPAIAERAAIMTAIGMADTAVAAVDNDSTAAEVSSADSAIMAARSAITAATNVPAEERAANTGTVNALASRLTAAKTARQMAMDDAQRQADMAMAATAAKLYSGISAPVGDGAGNNDRYAAYNAAGTVIEVTIGAGDAAGTAVTLSEDKKAMVPANHGWAGKGYADPAGGDMYEAVVYSNVEAPTQGKKFGGAAANDEFEYALSSGALAIDTTAATTPASRVAGSSFDHSAGTKQFKLPDPNPNAQTIVTIPGSYHGVSGTYSCTPGTATCAANVVESGFELGTMAADGAFTDGNGGWMFTPSDPNARVMSSADTVYASYGWWIRKSADDSTYTASAFVDDKGDVPDAADITALMGTATYMGGAAGKYALSSSTGGTNDAGHFTARAMLEADFNADMITGTIDTFMGADGMARDWSVELMKTAISNTGAIAGDGTSGNTDLQMTKWTIGETAAAAAGQWSGSLQDNGTDGVPKVATGTFYSMYGMAGKMVGAFGANKQ